MGTWPLLGRRTASLSSCFRKANPWRQLNHGSRCAIREHGNVGVQAPQRRWSWRVDSGDCHKDLSCDHAVGQIRIVKGGLCPFRPACGSMDNHTGTFSSICDISPADRNRRSRLETISEWRRGMMPPVMTVPRQQPMVST